MDQTPKTELRPNGRIVLGTTENLTDRERAEQAQAHLAAIVTSS